MSDPIRSEASHTPEPATNADREAKIEQLLLAGLEHYLAARYEHAINIWTRALFLDRSHAKARAYIDRARTALAERQRESEALLHDGAAAIDRGDSSEARRLVHAAMNQAGPSDEAIVLLERAARLDHVFDVGTDSDLDGPRLTLDDAAPSRSRAAWLTLAALVIIIVAAGLFAAGATSPEWSALVERSMSRQPDPHAAAAAIRLDELPAVPRRAAAALDRARALVRSGRLHDAIPLLESVPVAAPERSEADRLRGDIQRQLMALESAAAGAALGARGTNP
ncbi:MAG: hypothetical protein AB7Q29_05975 [Vicinamibacterales bacterium]